MELIRLTHIWTCCTPDAGALGLVLASTAEPKYYPADDMPKVGIDPRVDDRRHGARENLEGHKMALPHSMPHFSERRPRHPSGLPGKPAIAENCIGNLVKYPRVPQGGVAVSLPVTPCWCYGAETTHPEI